MINVIRSKTELQRVQSDLDEEQHYPYGLIEYNDEELNDFSHFAEFLEFNRLRIVELGQYSLMDILYSQYYWFTKFVVRYESIYGKNESMRQEQFKMMETIDRAATSQDGETDWGLLEKIEKDLGYTD